MSRGFHWSLLASMIFIVATPIFAQVSSEIDFSYGADGGTIVDLGGIDRAGDLVIQPDGKAVCVGSAADDSSFLVTRFTADGALDVTFGGDGTVVTAITGDDVGAAAVLLQPDGKIIATGRSGPYGSTQLTLIRYLASGTLDATFGVGGLVTTAVGSSHNWIGGAGLCSDGKIVVAGTSWLSTYDFVLARYLANGVLDSTFGTGGIVSTDPAGDWDFAYGMTLAPDGKIIAVGLTRTAGNYDFMTVRYDSTGALDPTFGAGGVVITAITPAYDGAFSVVVQGDQKIVVAGSSDGANKIAVVRYTTTGALDTSFSGDGIVEVNLPTVDFQGRDLALLPGGDIVVAGMSSETDSSNLAMICLHADGSLNTDFGGNGTMTIDVGMYDDGLQAVALQRDGKLVAVGTVDGPNDSDFIILRLHGTDAETIFWDDFESGTVDFW